MSYTFGNISLQQEQGSDSLAPVDLRRRNTGRPIFILPTTSLKDNHPEIRFLSSPEHLYSIYNRKSDPYFQHAFDELDFFFSSGGNEALLLLIQVNADSPSLNSPEDFDLVEKIIGRAGSFRDHQGIYALREQERIADVLVFPGLARMVSAPAYRGFLLQLADFLRTDSRFFALIDAPQSRLSTDKLLSELDCHTMTMVEGSIRLEKAPERHVSPSTFAAASIQQSDAQRGCENSPTNLRIPVAGYLLENQTDEEIAARLLNRLTVVRQFNSNDWRWWGSRTLDKSSEPSQYISCVRYVQSLKETLEEMVSPFVWDLATARQCKAIQNLLEEFFQQYFDRKPSGANVDLPPKPKCSVGLKATESSDSVLNIDIEVYLTIPMTWMDVQLSYEG